MVDGVEEQPTAAGGIAGDTDPAETGTAVIAESMADSGPSSPPRKPRRTLIVAISILGAFVACAVIGVVWFMAVIFNEIDVYDRAEDLYLTPANAFIGDGRGLQQDAGAYITANAEKLSAARAGIAAAQKEIGSVGDPADREEYVSTLAAVDAAYRTLESMALAPSGLDGLSRDLNEAGAPLLAANDLVEAASDAYDAGKYDEMLVKAAAAESDAKKAAAALAALEKRNPGLGISDLRDFANVNAEHAAQVAALAKAARAGDKAGADKARAGLRSLSSKLDGAQKRAALSVANTIWRDPGKAISDALQELDRAQSVHEATYNRISGIE